MPKQPPRLNPEQKIAVEAGAGVWAVVAGPGSGKTTVLIQRYARLVQDGARPDDILSLTFTKEAASNMRKRAEAAGVPEKSGARVAGFLTFHSVALSFAQAEGAQFPFQLAPFPLATEVQTGKVVSEVARRFGTDPKGLRSYISLQKRTRVSPADAVRKAEEEGEGEKQALAYKAYEQKLRELGVLDFDSLLVEMEALLARHAGVRARWQYRWLQCDETQDLDSLQYAILRLMSERHGNVFCVGDAGQCQPAGTMVSVLRSPQRGRRGPVISQVPIETLVDGDQVLSWTKQDQRVYRNPRSIRVGSRFYSGPMITVNSGGASTQMTPDHWAWARFSKKAFAEKPYFIYLMYREDRGFRVGYSHVRREHSSGCGQLTQRGTQEKADRFWILQFVGSRDEAETMEEIISLRYRIPQSVFHQYNGVKRREDQIRRIFESVPRSGGLACLEDHGKLFEAPLVRWPLQSHQKFRGYFRTAACNLFAGMMELPTPETNGSSEIASVSRKHFEGKVYSLEVEKDHTYIADGIPVGNCIYSFRGSEPELFLELHKTFPGAKTLYLAKNHRSTQSIVEFCRTVGPVKELAARFHTENPVGRAPEILRFAGQFEEATEVVRRIKERVVHNPDSVAILARTNRALRPFEDALSTVGIRYKYLGRAGFFSQPEIRSLLSYVQCIHAPYDSAVLGALRAPFEPTRFLRKKEIADTLLDRQKRDPAKPSIHRLLGDYVPNDMSQMRALQGFKGFLHGLTKLRNLSAAEAVRTIIRDVRAADYYAEGENSDVDNNPSENLVELVRSADRFKDVPSFLEHVRKIQGAVKSKKGVCLGTIHASKGSEFDDVMLVDCAEGVLPHKNAEGVAEEERIFFVGISRAALHLVITYSGQPSRFLLPFLPQTLSEKDPFFDE